MRFRRPVIVIVVSLGHIYYVFQFRISRVELGFLGEIVDMDCGLWIWRWSYEMFEKRCEGSELV